MKAALLKFVSDAGHMRSTPGYNDMLLLAQMVIKLLHDMLISFVQDIIDQLFLETRWRGMKQDGESLVRQALLV